MAEIGDSLLTALNAITPANTGVRGDTPSANHIARLFKDNLFPEMVGIAVGKFTADGALMTVGTGEAVAGEYVNEPELLGTPVFVWLANQTAGLQYYWHTGMAAGTAGRNTGALVGAAGITVRANEFDIGASAINVDTQVLSYVVIFKRA